MSTDAEGSWTPTLPFLVLAYPVTFLLFRGGGYCGPVCFSSTLDGVASVVASLLVLGLLASGIAALLRTVDAGADAGAVRRVAAPPSPAVAVLLALFGAFVVFLTMDALTLYEAVWKPVVLPLSFLLFAPVWLLYMMTYPFAVLFSVAGVDPSPAVTLATRGVVVAVGFPLSAVVQTYAVSAVFGTYDDAND